MSDASTSFSEHRQGSCSAWGPSTQSVHAGAVRQKPFHALVEPIVQTATYVFQDSDEVSEFMEARKRGNTQGRVDYGRYGNPTVAAVEARLASLEHAGGAVLFSSGMAAVTTTLLALLARDSHIVVTDDCYRRTRQFCQDLLPRYGVRCSVVPMGDYDALEAAICPETRLLFSETPTNPYLRVLDLERYVHIARRHGLLTVVDATFASPINQRPLEWGVDVVVHSATKYLAGHNDLLAGVVLGDNDTIAYIRETVNTLGCIVDPHNAYLLLRGLKTLGLRVRQQNQTGLLAAKFLESHPAVERVWYPGLPSHPEYEVAARQMDGFGGVVSFNIRGDYSLTARFVDSLKLPYISPSLGGVESLVTQPALMTYADYSPEERKRLGIEDNLVRLAVGVEDAQDILADLDQALRQVWQPEHSLLADEIACLQESSV